MINKISNIKCFTHICGFEYHSLILNDFKGQMKFIKPSKAFIYKCLN